LLKQIQRNVTIQVGNRIIVGKVVEPVSYLTGLSLWLKFLREANVLNEEIVLIGC